MNNEEVGKISYSVVIDLSALRSGAKPAEQAVKTSFNNIEQAVNKSTKGMERDIQGATTSLVALAGSIVALQQVGNFLGGAIDSANKYQASLLGLNSVSLSFTGESKNALKAAQDLSSDGLIPLADSATGLKNLLASGYGLEESIKLMNAFKDSAAFGRQSSLSFGEAVRSATEGIKNGNSILVDNAGVTKNLSVILEEFGYSQQDVMRATTDAGVRMAIYNGIMRETAAQTGDAAKLTQTAAGADASLGYAVDSLNIKVGSLANTIRKDAVIGLAQFINQNQNAIISIGSGLGAMVAFAAGAYGLTKALGGLRMAMTLIARHPVVATLTVLSGILAGFVVDNLMQELEGGFNDMGDSAGNAVPQLNDLGNASDDLGKKLRDLDEQTDKVNRDYTENLARLVRDHEKSIKDLTQQIKNENQRYAAAVSQRFAAFQDEQGKEQEEHGKKTKALQSQIDFLRKYNNASNRQQLSELQFTLAQENAQYEKRNQERLEKYNADIEAEKVSNDQKVADNQARLNEDLALLEKHRADVNSVRGVILLDEIDSLKRSRDEQLKSLAQQRSDVYANNSQISGSYGALANDVSSKLSMAGKGAGEGMGKAFGEALKDALWRSLTDMWNELVRFANNNPFQKWLQDRGRDFGNLAKNNGFADFFQNAGRDFGRWVRGYETGGFTGAGRSDEPAGVVHKGEYVLKKSMVNQSTGLPDPVAMQQFAGATGGASYVVKINVSGAIVSSPQDTRKFAEVIGKKINEIMQNKGIKPVLEGI